MILMVGVGFAERSAAQSSGGAAGAQVAADQASGAAAEARALIDRLRELTRAADQPPAPVIETQGPDPTVATQAAPDARSPATPAAQPAPTDPSRGPPAAQPDAASPPRPPSAEPSSPQEILERAEQAAKRAEAAADDARAAANAAQRSLRAYRDRYARKGFYLGAAVFYGLEDFDTNGLDVDNGYGAAAFIGYRIHRNIAIEVRGELLDGFDLDSNDGLDPSLTATVDGYAVTAAVKVYPLPQYRLQPFISMGVGAIHLELDGARSDGSRFDDQETEVVFRPGVGLDLFLSEAVVLNLEAAYVGPGGDLTNLDYGAMSAGLTFRF